MEIPGDKKEEHPLENIERDYIVVHVKEGELEEIIQSIKEKIQQPVDSKQTCDSSFTIHEVDSNLRNGNDAVYTPHLVSIGPYHYGKENIKEMQDVKAEYLRDLMQRSPEHVDPLSQYLAEVRENAEEARKRYSRALDLSPKQFVEIMLVDGCFLIEFMLKSYLNDRKDQTNIVKTKMSLVMTDLLLVENQIPFVILEALFKVYKQQDNQYKNDDSFTIEVLALYCFCPGDRLDAQMAAKACKKDDKSFHHLLHLYHSSLNQRQDRGWKDDLEYEKIVDRMSTLCSESYECNFGDVVCFIPTALVVYLSFFIVLIIKCSWIFITKIISLVVSKLWNLIKLFILLPLSLYLRFMKYLTLGRIGKYGQWTSGIPNTRYLRDTGFKFKKKDTSCFIDVTRSGRTIEIPMLCMQQTTTIHYKNLIALEHFSDCYGQGFTGFAKFMDYLIDTEEDVAILRESGIIDNRLGKDEEVAIFFNDLLKGIHIKDEDVPLFLYVQKYYSKGYYKVRFFQWRKKLVPEYFSNPWAVPSMIAAFILLVLTVVQTFYTIYPYYYPRTRS